MVLEVAPGIGPPPPEHLEGEGAAALAGLFLGRRAPRLACVI